MIGSTHNNFSEILKFANLSFSRKLKPREYYQIYSIFDSWELNIKSAEIIHHG